jgi:hypothetical protein
MLRTLVIVLFVSNNATYRSSMFTNKVVKYYELEESFTPDFSNMNLTQNLYTYHFKPSRLSGRAKYCRVRAVYTDSTSQWSKVVPY